MPKRVTPKARSASASPTRGPASGQSAPITSASSTVAFQKELTTFKEILGQLEATNFHTWMEQLNYIAYIASWPSSILDVEFKQPDWDGIEETDDVLRHARRTAYALVRGSLHKSLRYLSRGMKIGNASGLYKAVYNRFCNQTIGARNGLKDELAAYTMDASGEVFESWAANLQERHEFLSNRRAIQRKQS